MKEKTKPVLELISPELDGKSVYVTGNFNNWTPAEDLYKMEYMGKGRYRLLFPPDMNLPETLEYKYVRGENWDHVELDGYGNHLRNRLWKNPSGVREDYVMRWRSVGREHNPEMMPLIETISDQFDIPQLGKKRRVRILLPYNYYASDERFPVLYMHDAQNLFNDKNPFGNWAIDRKLSVLSERGSGGVIVVAVDHGEQDRIDEYAPFPVRKGNKPEGKQYVRFLADTLKPYVDAHYRSRPERRYTGIGGSSMGGLISIYAGLMYPEMFGRLMIFSPSLWAWPGLRFGVIQFFEPQPTRIYMYAGGKESKDMLPSVKRFKEAIAQQGFNDAPIEFKVSIDRDGTHQERHWSEEFPKAVEWLFYPEMIRDPGITF